MGYWGNRLFVHLILTIAIFCHALYGSNPPAKEVRLRDLENECGLYLSTLKSPSNGVKVADLSEKSIREWLGTSPQLDGLTPVVVGLPIFGHERKQKLDEVKSIFNAHGIETKIKTIDHPEGIFEIIYYVLPRAEDWQKPQKAEILASLTSWSISSGVNLVVMFSTQKPGIAAGVFTANALQSAATTFPAQFMRNYFSRSRNFSERVIKQIGLTVFFTVGLMLGSHIGADGLTGVVDVFSLSGGAELISKWPAILFQVAWRTPTENAIPNWTAIQTRKGHERMARAWSSWYRALSTNIATPAWAYATIAGSSFFNGEYGHWNWGHVVMAGVAVVHTIGWMKPQIYNIPVNLWHRMRHFGPSIGQRPKDENPD